MRNAETILHTLLSEQSRPLVFATISGAHLYGFASPDSDFDLRGAHVLGLPEVVGLHSGPETIEAMDVRDGVEVDLVTHDIRKFCGLLLKRNGYVLEQVLSPFVVATSDEHGALIEIAKECVTKYHAHHYLGFADSTWKLFRKEETPRVKPLLYTFRVLLTGIWLMRTGELEPNLARLNESFRLPYIDDLIAQKVARAEQTTLPADAAARYEAEYQRLVAELERAMAESTLPEMPRGKDALNDLLIRIRLEGVTAPRVCSLAL